MRKTSNDIIQYLLNPSFSHDIILIEATFAQFSIVNVQRYMWVFVYVTYIIFQVTKMSM